MDHEPPKTYRLTRFSLLNLVLMTTIVALGITVFLQYRELAPLRVEVRQLREETGQLVVDDPTKLQAIGIDTYNDWAWKWRIWIPAGKAYRVRSATADIPKRGQFPSNVGFSTLGAEPEGRELVLSARIERKPSGELRLAIAREGTTSYSSVLDKNSDWLLKGSIGSSFEEVADTTRTAKPGEPLVLIRKQVYYASPSGQIPPRPEPDTTDGLMVWLEEAPQ